MGSVSKALEEQDKSLVSPSVRLEAEGGCVATRSHGALEQRCVHTPVCVCARLAGPGPDEIMDLSDRILGNGGKKKMRSAPHPAAALSWRAAVIRPPLQGGAGKFM